MHQVQTQAVWSLRSLPPFYCLPERARNAAFEAIDKLNASSGLAMFCALAAMTAASQANVDVQRPEVLRGQSKKHQFAANRRKELTKRANARQSNFEAIEIENVGEQYCHPPEMSSVVKEVL